MIAYKQIGRLEGKRGLYVLEDAQGNRIRLKNTEPGEDTIAVLKLLPEPELFADQVLFGRMFYHRVDHRMYIQPLSIITKQNVIRLAY